MSIATGSPLRLEWSGRKAEAWSWLPAEEIVLILAVRHHREAGYSEE